MYKKSIIEWLRNKKVLSVATHDGDFHVTDVFSIALLKKLTAVAECELKIYRVRDARLISHTDMRVDVGGKYSEATLDFDHHSNTYNFAHTNGIRETALGLLAKWCMDDEFYHIFKQKFLLGLEFQDMTTKPHSSYTSLGHFVPIMLPAFGEEERDMAQAFEQAVDVAGIILERCLATTQGILRADQVLNTYIIASFAGGQILYLKDRIPIIQSRHPEIAFIIFQNHAGYTIFAMNNHVLAQTFRGLRASKIERACGYPGQYINTSGYSGVMDTLDGAKEICARSL